MGILHWKPGEYPVIYTGVYPCILIINFIHCTIFCREWFRKHTNSGKVVQLGSLCFFISLSNIIIWRVQRLPWLQAKFTPNSKYLWILSSFCLVINNEGQIEISVTHVWPHNKVLSAWTSKQYVQEIALDSLSLTSVHAYFLFLLDHGIFRFSGGINRTFKLMRNKVFDAGAHKYV